MDVQLPESELDLSDVAPIGLEFAFRIRILFKERVIFSPTTPNGGRVYVPPAGGDVFGPRLTGRVVPNSGADWGRFHSDGAAELNAACPSRARRRWRPSATRTPRGAPPGCPPTTPTSSACRCSIAP